MENDPGELPQNRQALAEALSLSAEIVRNIELGELTLSNVALKTARLARLLNELDYQKIMEYEAGGYPSTPNGVNPNVWALGVIAGRTWQVQDKETKNISEPMYTESIGELEHSLKINEKAIDAARDPDVSVSSANPNQYVFANSTNRTERATFVNSVALLSRRLASRRSMIYQYALRKYYELKFSGLADDIFARTRERVDEKVGRLIPDSIQKFAAVYDNLLSENPENWANAVHSCRRILQDLADSLFPATEEDRLVISGDEQRRIKLGKDNYINRILAYVEDHSSSDRFEEIVGSHLAYLGERLDSVFQAAQKGSHSSVSREEADRYVIYTYLIIGDILSLYPAKNQ